MEEPKEEPKEGWEAFGEDAAEGALGPSRELEEAMREAAEAVESRSAERSAPAAEAAEPELAQLRAELERLKDRHLRLGADFENHRRRMLKEREEAFRYGHENLVKELLPVVDNLERALAHARRSEGGGFDSMLQGVELVQRELLGTLARFGVAVIEADGAPFDPEVHQAVAQELEESLPVNTVVKVFEKGYRLHDRMLRPARVVVSKRSEAGGGAAE